MIEGSIQPGIYVRGDDRTADQTCVGICRCFPDLCLSGRGAPPCKNRFFPEDCGMCGQCHCYFVVEGDGSVYPCDFYCMDEYRLGSVGDSFSELITGETAESFVADKLFFAHAQERIAKLGQTILDPRARLYL